MKKLGMLLLAIWLIVANLVVLLGIDFPFSDLILPILAIAAGVLLLLDLRGSQLRKNLGTLLLGIWLILVGVVPLLSISFPSSDMLTAILSIAAGVLLLLGLGKRWRKELGMLLLCIWLILAGALPLLSVGFPAAGTLLAVLAVAAGVLLLLGR